MLEELRLGKYRCYLILLVIQRIFIKPTFGSELDYFNLFQIFYIEKRKIRFKENKTRGFFCLFMAVGCFEKMTILVHVWTESIYLRALIMGPITK